ncbi:PhoX family protein [Streptomyces litchfieldiae]|uniref:PhoX family phosphatase n=1 Tax=Streptomyces litchfieldiae TaxID=3075543 RepID=A0ABU2MRM5_9ACTN|nr:PhoX family phosphatase [Streptomyces sp. DSM 44938]MDT0344185.1 PhoX family phosphatase [Streptomyces sp. DSM 44938]
MPLPLLASHPGGRAALTCRYRCGDACSHPAPNASDNAYFGDLIARAVSRRSLLRAGAVVGVAAGAGGGVLAGTASAARGGGGGARGLGFEPVAPNTADALTVPPGYRQQVVIRWGDPVLRGAPEFAPARQTAAAQAAQFGYNCDYMALLDLPRERDARLLVVNHEYTSEEVMFPGYDPDNPTREQVEIAWAAHGLAVVVLAEHRRSGKLTPVAGHRLNRRITATTPFEFTGPAAGSDLLKTSADPTGTTVLGTLNNCGGGTTPWGTVLSGEENFNQYFGNAASVTDPTTKARLARYGMSGGASERKWERFDQRFDLAAEPNEVNRHGWVVEIDPYDPTSTPRKLTALGRFKHEAAEPRLTRDGRVVVYMGDDERFDYFYKYVSTHRMMSGTSRRARRHNRGLLEEGTLYVAKFTGNSPAEEIDGTGALPEDGEFDGSGEWIPLASGDRSFVDGMTAEEVYVFTRQAADKVGATKMDRPEDVEPNPRTGAVYIALTNNTRRGAAGQPGPDEANPRTNNKHGQVVEVMESRNDPSATRFTWRLLLVCGDPNDPGTYFAGFAKDQVSPISCPDNLAFDPHGNLWISTDGNALGANDGLFGVALEGSNRGQVKQFLTVPVGGETCGPIVEEHRVLVAVQHPGEVDGSSHENPGSHWPDGPGTLPRPSVVNVTRTDGRRIGS